MQITTAIILAGGLGTRLRSVVPDLPKCMAPVAGIPFISYVISYLKKEGIENFIFSLGYKSEDVVTYLEKTYPALLKTYVIEPEPLGTGGGIQLACKEAKDDTVVVVNGDTLFNVDIPFAAKKHFQHNADCTLALKPLTDFSRYGTVEVDPDSYITGFHEKKHCKEGFINGGLYIIQVKSFLSQQLHSPFSFENDFLTPNTRTLKFYGVKSDGFFIDIGIPEDYQKFQDYANRYLSKEKNNTIEDERSLPASYGFGGFIDSLGAIVDIFK